MKLFNARFVIVTTLCFGVVLFSALGLAEEHGEVVLAKKNS